MKYSLEPRYEIWDDEHGDRIEVGYDRDGLDLIEIRHIDDKGKKGCGISVPDEAIPLLIKALEKVQAFKQEKDNKSYV